LTAVVDNDVILKSVCYDAAVELLGEYGSENALGVLGAAAYVVTKRIRKASLVCGAATALTRLQSFLESTEALEPSPAESYLAAELEVLAQAQGAALDSGESQLCALVITRSYERLLTGDKRAVVAIQSLLAISEHLTTLTKKIVCLEQLVLRLAVKQRGELLRSKICAEPNVDKTLSICFSCKSPSFTDGVEGLESYISALRADAPDTLSD